MFCSVNRISFVLFIAAMMCFVNGYSQDQSEYAQQQEVTGEQAAGRWDITVSAPDGSYPSWLEIEKSGLSTLVGRFVGQGGSARPISEIEFSAESKKYSFTIPPQWSSGNEDLHAEFSLKDGRLTGWMTTPEGDKLQWTGVRAPRLKRETEPQWGDPIQLLNNGLADWKIPENSQWIVEDGVLINKKAGGNLITKQKFRDFKLHAEFRYPEESNSGIYLRGRYEMQIINSYGMEPDSHLMGGVYGFIAPSVNAAKKAGEWQTYDITLTGRMVTVVLNGTEVICNREIPGITGGALDSNEGAPGPIQLQGDHGAVEFRNISITPAVK